jgi:hypothetical protein
LTFLPLGRVKTRKGREKIMATKRHWKHSDFVVTSTSTYDDGASINYFGYCNVCKGDMQQFGVTPENKETKAILHYNSHKNAARLGLWGKR